MYNYKEIEKKWKEFANLLEDIYDMERILGK